jgi:hypothetical protein
MMKQKNHGRQNHFDRKMTGRKMSKEHEGGTTAFQPRITTDHWSARVPAGIAKNKHTHIAESFDGRNQPHQALREFGSAIMRHA